MNPKIRYDHEDDVLMVWLAEGKTVDRAEQTGQSILHMSEQGEPILLEILNAHDFILSLVDAAIRPAEAARS